MSDSAKIKVLVKRLGKLKNSHNTLTENVEEILEKVKKIKILTNRQKTKIKKLNEISTGLVNELHEKVKGMVELYLYNSHFTIMKSIAIRVAKNIINEHINKAIKIKTKTILSSNISVKLIKELSNDKWFLAAVLNPPIVKEAMFVFQKSEFVDIRKPYKKLKETKRTPA